MDAAVATGPFQIDHYPSALIDRVALDDGRCVVIRPVLPQDAAAEQLFVGGLSLASRQLRFHIAIRELAPDLLRSMTEIDYRTHVAVVAVAAREADDGDEPVIVADARYVMTDDSSEAEFAIAVADAWQGVGLGRYLMAALTQHARRRGITRLFGDVLHGNKRMITMVREAGGHFVKHPGDATLMRARFAL
jgi:acetyltransferase